VLSSRESSLFRTWKLDFRSPAGSSEAEAGGFEFGFRTGSSSAESEGRSVKERLVSCSLCGGSGWGGVGVWAVDGRGCGAAGGFLDSAVCGSRKL